MGRLWFRCNPDSDANDQLTRDVLGSISRVILKHNDVFVVPDTQKDGDFSKLHQETTRSNANTTTAAMTDSNISRRQSPDPSPFRFLSGAPLLSPEGYRLGAFCMLSTQPRTNGITEEERTILKDFASLAVKSMVDRRKLTTQGNPSHLVACTAHDLITPLTGIQLSLSLLQQDSDFADKLGKSEEQREFLSGAVRSSNMMLRICQSTIETLRGNRSISNSSTDFLPRNLMQIAEASPFIDMAEFIANLKAISRSIPKRVPLNIVLSESAPPNIVSDGLKIFRSALNLLSNACSRTESGFITMTIRADHDGFLLFECEDTGKDVEFRNSQALFSHDSTPSNFGLYSVAYQVSWLGGKYGVRKRGSLKYTSSGDLLEIVENSENSEVGEGTGAVFWFSVPIVLPQDVSELVGLAKSLTDNNERTGVPTFKAELPQTPPSSPQLECSNPTDSPHIPTGVIINKGETTRTLNALIIEDSTTVRKLLGRALSKLGYQVFEAGDGMEGLRELKANLFDMVLCDFLMPVMDGLDCVQQYREWEVTNRQALRQYVIGISAHASKNDIERGIKLGMDDFKPKPIVLKTLKELHESPNLRAVRSKLDGLMSLPSMELKQKIDSVENSHLSSNVSGMKRLGVTSNENGTGASTQSSPLFSISPKKRVTPKNSALFSIATKLVESETKQIASNLTKNDNRGDSKMVDNIFSISMQDDQNKFEANGQKTEGKQPALCSVEPNTATNTAAGSSKQEATPLFSLAGNLSRTTESNPKPLFAISSNTASEPDRQKRYAEPDKEGRKDSPLIALPSEKTANASKPPTIPGSGSGQNEAKGAAPLFDTSPGPGKSGTKEMASGRSNAKTAALFEIYGNSSSTSQPSSKASAKRPALSDFPNLGGSSQESSEIEDRPKKRWK